MEIVILAVKVLHIIVSILLILVVLLQPGKSGDLGSIFGSSGAVPFLVKVTRGLAVLFFLTSLSLGYFAMGGGNKSVISDIPAPVTETAPMDSGDGGMSTEGGAATEGAPTEGERHAERARGFRGRKRSFGRSAGRRRRGCTRH